MLLLPRNVQMTEADWVAKKKVYGALIGALNAVGVFVDTDWLQPVTTAIKPTRKCGAQQVPDDPFADTK